MSIQFSPNRLLFRTIPPWDWISVAAPGFLAAGFTSLGLLAGGRSLGPIIAGWTAGALLIPCCLPDGRAGRTWRRRWIRAGGVVVGTAAVWLALIGSDAASVGQWAQVSAMLAAYALAMMSLLSLIRRLRFSAGLVRAAGIAVGLAWLTWPIWLSPLLANGSGNLARAWLTLAVPVHPILASNGILTFTAPWTEQTIAYQLTVLDQDVPIQVPATALAGVSFYVTMAMIMGLIGKSLARFRRYRGRQQRNGKALLVHSRV